MGELAIMGRPGDTKVIWSRDRPEEVENARRTFDDLRKKGYLAWSVRGRDGEKDVQIHAFDPDAERLIMAPPMRGGSPDPIAAWLCEELGVIYPENPEGKVTDLMNDTVLDRLASCIRIRLGGEHLQELHRSLLKLRGPKSCQ